MVYRIAFPKEKVQKPKMRFSDILPILLPIAIPIAMLSAFAGMIYGLNHNSEARAMHAEHDTYILNQERCRVHNGWYVHSEDYPNMISCHRLDNHEQFYVTITTGMVVVQAAEDD